MVTTSLQLTTLTPVSIGSGKVLSPYTDFFPSDDGQQLIYMEPERLKTALRQKAASDPGVVDRYVRLLYANMDATGNKSRVPLQKLQGDLGLSAADFPEKYAAFGLDDIDDPKIKLHQILRNAGAPYVAGSTLKGAIKTALLHDWLTQKFSGKRHRDDIMASIENTWQTHREALAHRDEIDATEDRQFKRKLQDRYRYELDELAKAVKVLEKNMENHLRGLLYYEHVERDPNGREKKEAPDFAHLLCSDTNPLPVDAIIVHKVERLNLKSGALELRQLRECIAPEQHTHLTLRIGRHAAPGPRGPARDFFHPDLQYLNGSDAVEQLLAQVRQFSADALRWETAQLQTAGRWLLPDLRDRLTDFYEARLRDLTAPDAPHTQLRLGHGKRWHYNAIGLAIEQHNPATFAKMRQLFRLGKPGQQQFPLTQVLATETLQPMGWVELK